MTDRRRPSIYTVSPDRTFVDSLAAGLMDRHGGDPFGLSDFLVLLPSRRAAQSLREAFLRAGDRPMLLPTMRAIGDVDSGDLDLFDFLSRAEIEIAPEISVLKRQMMLAADIASDERFAEDPRRAIDLAGELGRLIDQAETERLDFAQLAALVPDEFAAHWQITLDFLKLITERWPERLGALGLMDPAGRRDRLLAAQARHWRDQPPSRPIYIAGSTGSLPATAQLMAVVARLPAGGVILPGLDLWSDDATWRAIGEAPTHPQYGLHHLLRTLEVDRDDVEPWPSSTPGEPSARARLLMEAMRPASTTARWRKVWDPERSALIGLRTIECDDAQEEAGVIALLMREAVETPGRTAALVTGDRQLARRVAAELKRWKLDIDDSSGVPLAGTPPGTFFALTATMVAEAFAPVAMLAALKHPLAAGGGPRAAFRRAVRRLERLALRGPAPAPGLAGIVARLGDDEKDGALRTWLNRLAEKAAPLTALIGETKADPLALLQDHVAFVEWLSLDEGESSSPLIWHGEAGEALARLIDEMADALAAFGPVNGVYWPAIVSSLMATSVVRPRVASHPRLHIWGLLEARMQRADLVVLAGLNEGAWPPRSADDPWMSRPMRADFGLPLPERRVGLSAHDFAQLASSGEVVLTRARKAEGAPTVPSRWLLRLQALIGRDNWQALDRAELRGLFRQLDWKSDVRPAPAPRPTPPVSARPDRISVTEVEDLIRDPYSVYSRRVLGLRALPPLAADPGAAERGVIVHEALERLLKAWPGDDPVKVRHALVEQGRLVFSRQGMPPAVRAFWWPRFLRIANWFATYEVARRHELAESWVEVAGQLDLPGRARRITLTAKADRIDRLQSGGHVIIDYKTGRVPSDKQVKAGLSPQLPLEAAIAAAGGFVDVPRGPAAALIYIRLTGAALPGEVRAVDGDPAVMAATALENLCRLLAAFERPSTPYLSRPRPMFARQFAGDYDHLARVREWSVPGEEE